jgi:reverse gyrase
MLSQITRTLSRTTTSYNTHLRKNLSKLLLSNQQFSTIVPGVGKGKTSTGLVSIVVGVVRVAC